MRRDVCESKIMYHLEEIFNIYKEYNPDGDYLTMSIVGNSISFNNNYWDFPDNKKVDNTEDYDNG